MEKPENHASEGEAPTLSYTGEGLCVRCGKRRPESGSRVRGAFLANMSHELRTPLNGIIGFSELLEAEHMGPLNADQRAYVEHILTSGRHLLSLVNDLLDLAKLDTGRLTLSREWTSLDAVLEGAVSGTSGYARSKGVSLDVSVAPDLPALFVDPYRVRQIASNLILHGIKRAGEDGHVKLRLLGEGQTVTLSVTDDGASLSDDEIARLFRSFEDLDEQGTEKADADLGVALTKRLIDMHGGTLEITNVPPRGAKLEVFLPATKHASELVSMPPIASAMSDELVLVVDDDPHARELIAGHLRASGVGVVFARNAEAAIELASVMRPAAITLDIEMPGADGWTALQHLKRSSTTRNIPVIVISVVDESARAKRLGAAGFEAKPVSKHGLARALGRAGVELYLLDDVRVVMLDRDNPEFDRVESKLRRAGCEVIRPGARTRDATTLRGRDIVVMDVATANEDVTAWLGMTGGAPLPFLFVGAGRIDSDAVARAHVRHARTTYDEILGFPERLIRMVRALLDGKETAVAAEGRA